MVSIEDFSFFLIQGMCIFQLYKQEQQLGNVPVPLIPVCILLQGCAFSLGLCGILKMVPSWAMLA